MQLTHIVNITDCVPRYFEKAGTINYLQIVICDRNEVNIIEYFPIFYWFLEDAFNQNLKLKQEESAQI